MTGRPDDHDPVVGPTAVAQLFEVVADPDLYASHLRVHEAVVHQAEELWDQLTRWLPVVSGRRKARVRRLITLVRAALVLGIADLDQVAIQANEAERAFERSANAQLNLMLTEAEYMECFDRAKCVCRYAARVKHSYDTLLEKVTGAFDGQLAHEAGMFQQAWIMIGSAILTAGFTLLATVLGQSFAPWKASEFSYLIGVLAASFLGMILLMRWLDILVSRWFRRHHRRLMAFLNARDRVWKPPWTTLEGQPAEVNRAWTKSLRKRGKRDCALARRCARMLDALARDEGSQPIWSVRRPRSWSVGRPRFKDLTRKVERWILKAYLVSDRSRQSWHPAVPRLTLLYRFYPMMGSELPPNPNEATEQDVVPDSDLRLTVAEQCSGHHEQIDQIQCWAHDQIKRSRSASRRRPARRFVKALNKVGLKPGMTRNDFKELLNKMDNQP